MIKEAMAGYAASLEKKWAHDRTRTVGGSEIGQCARKINFIKTTRHAREPIKVGSGWGASTRGKVMEDKFWYPAMKRKFKRNLLFAGPNQQTFQHETLSSTPDGLLINQDRDILSYLGVPDIGPSKSVLLECKTVDPRVPLREARAENTFQVQVGLGMIRMRTPHKPDWALITYTDASFWDEVTEFAVKFDEQIFRTAQIRSAAMLREAAADLKPEGYIAGGAECDHCPFVRPCGVQRRSVPVLDAAADPQFAAEIQDMCRELLAVRASTKTNEALAKEMEEAIKNRMREKGVRRISGVVTWSSVKGRQSWDNTAIKQKLAEMSVDIEQFSTVGEPTDRLQIL